MSSHMLEGIRVILYDHVPPDYKKRALDRLQRTPGFKEVARNHESIVMTRTQTLIWGMSETYITPRPDTKAWSARRAAIRRATAGYFPSHASVTFAGPTTRRTACVLLAPTGGQSGNE